MRLLVCALCLSVCVLCRAPICRAEDARSIVARAVAADEHSDRLARDYTYKVHNEIIEHNSTGAATSTHSTLDEVLYIGGKRYFHLLEKDGKPLSAAEQKKEQANLDRAVRDASRLNPAERDKRIADEERDRTRRRDGFKEIPDAFDFRLLGDDEISGRRVWKIAASPRASYHGKLHGVLNNVTGTLWIDKIDYNWAKVDADVLNPVRLGWFLARVDRGAHVSYEMMRVNDELWVPHNVELSASARLLLLKKLNVDQRVTFSDYRKFQTDSRIVSTDVEP